MKFTHEYSRETVVVDAPALDTYSTSSQITVSVPVQSMTQGRALATEELHRRFPGAIVSITGDRIVVSKGYEADALVTGIARSSDVNQIAEQKAQNAPDEPDSSNATESPENATGTEDYEGSENTSAGDAGPVIPRYIIVLSGNDKTWGLPHAPYHDSKPPYLIATVGDTEDHRLMDGRWQKALHGDAPLWDGYLAIKYRTNTVALLNGGHYTIEQGDMAIECDGEFNQKTAMACLKGNSSP